MNIPIKEDNFFPLVTELLIKIYATQTAMSNLMIDMASEKMDEREVIDIYNAEYSKSYQDLLDLIYSKYGHFDLKDLK